MTQHMICAPQVKHPQFRPTYCLHLLPDSRNHIPQCCINKPQAYVVWTLGHILVFFSSQRHDIYHHMWCPNHQQRRSSSIGRHVFPPSHHTRMLSRSLSHTQDLLQQTQHFDDGKRTFHIPQHAIRPMQTTRIRPHNPQFFSSHTIGDHFCSRGGHTYGMGEHDVATICLAHCRGFDEKSTKSGLVRSSESECVSGICCAR